MKLGPYELNSIITGDARELAESIPDESVDLIFTDPVYDRIEDYTWLAEIAARVLKPGKSVLAQCSLFGRFEAELSMSKFGLKHMPLLFDYFEFARNPRYVYKINVNARPYVWFCKGEKPDNTDWVFIAATSFKAMGRLPNGRPASKVYHAWGDEEEYYLKRIKSLTQPGAIVFDPFTGSGTAPAVCKMLSRQYLAFEIDPDTADLARRRVELTQAPLFVVEPEQLIMELPIMARIED